uniref:Apoptosis regulator Bcl-2-like n=1 Tax=Labrus bergylta TaxID=56723 RepID=A0A3Q3GME7_9LABR
MTSHRDFHPGEEVYCVVMVTFIEAITSRLLTSPSPSSPAAFCPHHQSEGSGQVGGALKRHACDDLARRYHGDLAANLSALSQQDGVEAAGLGGLTAVREELFRDGVNWGRIVAMMEVGGAVCSEAVKTGGAQQVEVIAGWMEEGLDSLQGWIDDNGGWVGGLLFPLPPRHHQRAGDCSSVLDAPIGQFE